MNEYIIKKVTKDEMTQVYLMGFETWNQGKSEKEYLEYCYNSEKLNAGQWFGIYLQNQLVGSLIVYKFTKDEFGFGSIVTEKKFRGQGVAQYLIQSLIEQLQSENENLVLIIYSDISPEYYQKFGFQILPPSSQKYPKSACMIRGQEIENYLSGKILPPDYF